MASMAISLHLKTKPSILNPTLIRFFSSSSKKTPDLTPDDKPSDPTPNDNPSSSPSQSQSEDSFSSFVTDVKSKLNQQSPPPQQQPQPRTPSSNAEIRRKLSQFHPKSTTSSPLPSSQAFSFDAIRENLKKIAPDGKRLDSVSRLKEGINLRHRDPKSPVIGGGGALPAAIFGREMKDRVAGESPEMKKKTQLFMKSYEPDELGKKLTELRPKNLKEFSIKELNERLVKVREIEEAETATMGNTIVMSDRRKSLVEMKNQEKEKNKHNMRCLILLNFMYMHGSYIG